MAEARILVVEDDEFFRSILVERLEYGGYEVAAASGVAAARALIGAGSPDVALLDVKLPDGDGTDLLEELGAGADCPCIMMTAHGTVASAVAALKLGAVDYLEKPFSLDRLEATLGRALELTALRREVRELRRRHGLAHDLVAGSDTMREAMRLVERVAPADSTTVLIEGETGTGKGVLARLVHHLSPRARGPFVNVPCTDLAETVMESELFGHERGAFTDARTLKRGLVELAESGTLFFDEIGEISLRLQGKLLRFIEEKTFRRVGGTRDLKVDARVVAATNRSLETEVREARFRADLYYRLRVVPIHLPPLRDRAGDIPALAMNFTDAFNAEFGKKVRRIAPGALELLERYAWPGNVRELRNVIERTVLLADGPVLTPEMLPPELLPHAAPPRGDPELKAAGWIEEGPDAVDLESLERTLLLRALERAGGNRTAAGALLGLSRHQVRTRLRKYGVEA